MRGYLIFILVVVSLPMFGSLGIGGAILGIAFAVLTANFITQHHAIKKACAEKGGLTQENSYAEKKASSSLVGIKPKSQVAFFGNYHSAPRMSYCSLSSENNMTTPSDLDVATAALNGARIENVTRNARKLRKGKKEQVFRYLQKKEALRNLKKERLSCDDTIVLDPYDPAHPLYLFWYPEDPFSDWQNRSFNNIGSVFTTEEDYFTRSDGYLGFEYEDDDYRYRSISELDDSYLEFDDSCFNNDMLIEDGQDALDVSDFTEDTEWLDDIEAVTFDDLDLINE